MTVHNLLLTPGAAVQTPDHVAKSFSLKILCLPITTAPAHQNGQKPQLAFVCWREPRAL